MRFLPHLWRRALGSLLPQHCFVCGSAAGNRVLCAACEAGLPLAPSVACPVCALASPQGEVCGHCLVQPPRFDSTRVALAYGFPVREMVHAVKFNACFELLALFEERLRAALTPGEWDAVIPVPLSAQRLRERGFNQSVLLARGLAQELQRPLCRFSVVKDGETLPQVGLDRAARRRNLRGAFRAQQRFDGARLLVVDDVMTSGATLDEMAAALKAAGAVRVDNLVLARTPSPMA